MCVIYELFLLFISVSTIYMSNQYELFYDSLIIISSLITDFPSSSYKKKYYIL